MALGGGYETHAVWREPVRGSYPPPGGMRLAGLERLERWLEAGPWPPLSYLTGAVPTAVAEGSAEARMPASPWLLNSAGVIGGGALAILADIVFSCAVDTRMPPATPCTTAELSLSFLHPSPVGELLHAHGRSIHVGRTVGLSEAFVTGPDGTLIAHGTSRLAILPPLEGLPEVPEPTGESASPDDVNDGPWAQEPVSGAPIGQDAWGARPGAEVLAGQIGGELATPPLHYLTGLTLREAAEGRAVMTMPASQWLTSPTGLLQGGTLALLADTTLLSAVTSLAPAGTAVAGVDLKMNYLRPAVADGRELTARAEVAHAGRSLTIARGEVRNADGKVVALATGSAIFLPGRPASLGANELSGSPSPSEAEK